MEENQNFVYMQEIQSVCVYMFGWRKFRGQFVCVIQRCVGNLYSVFGCRKFRGRFVCVIQRCVGNPYSAFKCNVPQPRDDTESPDTEKDHPTLPATHHTFLRNP